MIVKVEEREAMENRNPFIDGYFTQRVQSGERPLPYLHQNHLLERFESNQPWRLKAMERDQLLQEREKTHGSFADNAKISQRIKEAMRGYQCSNYPQDPCHREALDMIALKLSRILSGQANFKDHWADIAGYAKLAEEACCDDHHV